jgi:hypothetical protein
VSPGDQTAFKSPYSRLNADKTVTVTSLTCAVKAASIDMFVVDDWPAQYGRSSAEHVAHVRDANV